MKTIEIYTPGKVMLAGEYSVLRGGHALAATVDCGLNVRVTWDPKAAQWEIISDLWDEPRYVNDDRTPQIDLLCRAVQFMAKRTGLHGGRVEILSNIEIKHGIGSSSAIRLGICAAFLGLRENPNTPTNVSPEAIEAAWQLQSEGQGIASGYDIVTQFAGGLIEFNFEYNDNKWKPHWFRHDLGVINQLVHVYVGGAGAPTTETVQTTSSWLEGSNRFDKLIDASESLVDAFNASLKWPDGKSLQKLFQACGANRQLFSTNPYFPQSIGTELSDIPGLDRRWSWKTTGAGGEDAILVLGTSEDITQVTKKLTSLGWHASGHLFVNTCSQIKQFTSSESRTEERPIPSRPAKSAIREFLT